MALSKAEQLRRLYDEYAGQRQGLEVVTGSGDPDSRIMLIGEAPGKQEVLEGKPFVGKAGRILDDFFACLAIKRDEVYITNAIKYRLEKPGRRSYSRVNRPAKRQEILADSFCLLEEIRIIHPLLLVTLGNVALTAISNLFFAKSAKKEILHIGETHGRLMGFRAGVSDDSRAVFSECVADPYGLSREGEELPENDTGLFPLYHPASIIYNRSLERVYREDLARLCGILPDMFRTGDPTGYWRNVTVL
ncbi:MAG TPA: uracil-DNA glycosylase [Clostridiales bacterium]|nr:uracil-DNA glycosylase [Clostridiales bacterium]